MIWFILLLITSSSSAVSDNIACDSDVQTNVCLPRNYSNMDIPLNSEPNLIQLELHISDVLKINDRDFSITFSLYFNVQWREPRLHLNPSFFQQFNRFHFFFISGHTVPNVTLVLTINSTWDDTQLNPVDLYLISDLWVPNVFIYNLKTFKVGNHENREREKHILHFSALG